MSKYIKKDIELVKEAIVSAVLNDKSVSEHKDNLEILKSIESLQETIINTTINHFEGKLPTRIELHEYVNKLVDDASSDVVEPYRGEIIYKAETVVPFQYPMKKGREVCNYG